MNKVDNLWITFYIHDSKSAESALRAVTFFTGYRLTDYLALPKQEQKLSSVEVVGRKRFIIKECIEKRESPMFTSKGYKYAVYNPISNMRGVGIDVKAKLRARGIKYIWQLVEYGRTEKQRIELARQIDIPLTVLNMLVSRADLMRLRSVGDDLAYLLAAAGVSSCRNLLQHDPEHLHRRLIGLHIGQKIGYHTPTVAQVKSWISEAQELAIGSPE